MAVFSQDVAANDMKRQFEEKRDAVWATYDSITHRFAAVVLALDAATIGGGTQLVLDDSLGVLPGRALAVTIGLAIASVSLVAIFMASLHYFSLREFDRYNKGLAHVLGNSERKRTKIQQLLIRLNRHGVRYAAALWFSSGLVYAAVLIGLAWQ